MKPKREVLPETAKTNKLVKPLSTVNGNHEVQGFSNEWWSFLEEYHPLIYLGLSSSLTWLFDKSDMKGHLILLPLRNNQKNNKLRVANGRHVILLLPSCSLHILSNLVGGMIRKIYKELKSWIYIS